MGPPQAGNTFLRAKCFAASGVGVRLSPQLLHQECHLPTGCQPHRCLWQHRCPFYRAAAFLKHNWHWNVSVFLLEWLLFVCKESQDFFFFPNVLLSWVCKSIFRNLAAWPFFPKRPLTTQMSFLLKLSFYQQPTPC